MLLLWVQVAQENQRLLICCSALFSPHQDRSPSIRDCWIPFSNYAIPSPGCHNDPIFSMIPLRQTFDLLNPMRRKQRSSKPLRLRICMILSKLYLKNMKLSSVKAEHVSAADRPSDSR